MTMATWLGSWLAAIRGATALEMCCGGRRGPPSGDGGNVGNTTGHVDLAGNGGESSGAGSSCGNSGALRLRSALRSERLTRLVPMRHILPDQSYAPVGEARKAWVAVIDPACPLDQRQRSQLPLQMPLQVGG